MSKNILLLELLLYLKYNYQIVFFFINYNKKQSIEQYKKKFCIETKSQSLY